MCELGNRYIYETIFKGRLSSLEKEIYDTAELPADLNALIDKPNAYICYLLGQKSLAKKRQDAVARYQAGLTFCQLSHVDLARTALLCADFEVLALVRERLSDTELIALFSEHRPYKSAIANRDPFVFQILLDIPINAYETAKVLMTSADYRYFFIDACESGNLPMLRFLTNHLSTQEALSVIKADYYGAFKDACNSGNLDLVTFLTDYLGAEAPDVIKASAYRVCLQACESGNLPMLRFLTNHLRDQEVLCTFTNDYYRAFKEACNSGNLALVTFLTDYLGAHALYVIKASTYGVFRHACESGNLALVTFLTNHLTAQAPDSIKAAHYGAFRAACKSGNLALVTFLINHLGAQALSAIKAWNYGAFQEACNSGNLTLVTFLTNQLGTQEALTAIKADQNWAFRDACKSGNLALVTFLINHLGAQEALSAIKASTYGAFRDACKSGSLALLTFLTNQLGAQEALSAIKADQNWAFRDACESGSLALLTFLTNQLSAQEALIAIKADQNWAFRNACKSGSLALVTFLTNRLSAQEALLAIKAWNYGAFRDACKSGNLALLTFLTNQLGAQEALFAIKADQNWAFRNACKSGNLPVLRFLTNQLGAQEALIAIKADNYWVFRDAISFNTLDIGKQLLSDAGCFSYAEKHDFEYGQKITYDWVGYKIHRLQSQKARFDSLDPHGVFDINQEEAASYFYVLRNLIRRGVTRAYGTDIRAAENLSNEIRFLLSIPAIKSLCHQTITVNENSPGSRNELLRLAISLGNESASRILLQLPAVRRLAEQNSFYRAEARGNLDLRRLAQDRESSMVALSPSESQLLEKVKTHYKAKIAVLGGYDAVFSLFKSRLKSYYEENPASIELLDSDGKVESLTLPFEWKALEILRSQLTSAQYEQALKAYYQHDVHSAYRYLSKPNHWMHPQASYVYVSEDRKMRWSSFEEYLNIIVPFYLAAFDDDIDAINGYTKDTRKSLFIKQLALIGRAHNWDGKNEKGEEFDNMEPDQPSCYSGVKRRLWQSVLGHPLFQVMTEEKIQQLLINYTHDYFKELITTENACQIYDAFNRVVFNDYEAEESLAGASITQHNKTVDIDYLAKFNISAEKITHLIDELDKKFAEQIKANPGFVLIMQDFFSLKPENQHLHIMLSSKGVSIALPILQKIKDELDKNKKIAKWAIDKWKGSVWSKKENETGFSNSVCSLEEKAFRAGFS